MAHSEYQPQRPATAVTLSDIQPGSQIVSYCPAEGSKREIEIVEINPQFVDFGEYRTRVAYRKLNRVGESISYAFASDLGLAPQEDGCWRSYAIPFDQ